MAGDRLSDLPDDLLIRILDFTPVKEAASTSALARRWRSLWMSSSAVNLDSRSYDGKTSRPCFNFSQRKALLRDAEAALRLRRPAVRKLTLRLEIQKYSNISFLMSNDGGGDMVDALLSDGAARRVEELSLEVHEFRDADDYDPNLKTFKLSVGSLPSEALRVLHIANCSSLTFPEQPCALALLAVLRLQRCRMPLKDLQAMVDAAPLLHTLQLTHIFFDLTSPPCARLRCPAVTTLVLANCDWQGSIWRWPDRNNLNTTRLELCAPVLRLFTYSGLLLPLSIKPSDATTLVNLQIRPNNQAFKKDEHPRLFWEFLQSFTHAKALRLRVGHLEDVAVESRKIFLSEFLGNKLFSSLERLDLHGLYTTEDDTAAGAGLAIANFLRCCPAVRVLRLNLSTVSSGSRKTSYESLFDVKDQQGFGESVNRFLRRRSKQTIGPLVEKISGIPGLRAARSLTCLRSSLIRVCLQFRRDESNCFGDRLAKFFTQNALLLEKLYIDDGNHRLCEHINDKVPRTYSCYLSGVAKSSKRRKLASATNFQVFPLERSK